jgi:hypothetical protein
MLHAIADRLSNTSEILEKTDFKAESPATNPTLTDPVTNSERSLEIYTLATRPRSSGSTTNAFFCLKETPKQTDKRTKRTVLINHSYFSMLTYS